MNYECDQRSAATFEPNPVTYFISYGPKTKNIFAFLNGSNMIKRMIF